MRAISHLIKPENVISLIICNDWPTRNQIQSFNSLFDINQFSKLRSLTLYEINNQDLKYILEHVNTNHPISLSIKSCEREYANVWTLVSSARVQCYVQTLSVRNIDYQMQHITWSGQWILNYLAIQDCTYNEYLVILQQLPSLRTLVMRNCSFKYLNNTPSLSLTSHFDSRLTSLTVTDNYISQGNLALLNIIRLCV
ncbi:unnamed protein product [Adineta steineri]|uniref:Uncharacterized protein n=1 Tax=Adineta steineri TaxID=433720 RepID=A0A814P8X0_9BILA|nr:unnamed protein product [Adineta steineri]